VKEEEWLQNNKQEKKRLKKWLQHVIGQLPTVSEVANRKGLCYAKEGSLG
jgi:hypothetical protein